MATTTYLVCHQHGCPTQLARRHDLRIGVYPSVRPSAWTPSASIEFDRFDLTLDQKSVSLFLDFTGRWLTA